MSQTTHQRPEQAASALHKQRTKDTTEHLDKVLGAYENILWLYADAVCRQHPEQIEYLMSVELPFYLKSDVLADLEQLVNHIVSEQRTGMKAVA